MVVYRQQGELCIGKVVQIRQTILTISVHYGTLTGEWLPLQNSAGDTIVNEISRTAVVEDYIFVLTNSNRLPFNVQKKLKSLVS